MNDWSRNRPQVPAAKASEIPLQSPTGTYVKPWYRKHFWFIGSFGTMLFLVIMAGIVTPALTGSPHITVRLRTSGDVPMSVSPSELKLSDLPKGQKIEKTFQLTNKGDDAYVTVLQVNSAPPGVSMTWRLPGDGDRGALVPAHTTIQGTVIIESQNVDSGGFDMRVAFVSSKAQ